MLATGSWSANRVGGGGSPDNIESISIDSLQGGTSALSRRWLVGGTGDRTWQLRLKVSGSETLLDVGVQLAVQIQRNPS